MGFLRSSNTNHIDSIKVGDVVLVGSDDKKRLDWPLAQVKELFPGRDQIHRLVKVKTAKGYQLRPIQRLYPLELQEEERLDHFIPGHGEERFSTQVELSPKETVYSSSQNGHPSNEVVDIVPTPDVPVTTRSGRIVKVPKKLNV